MLELQPGDTSVQVHACFGALRQVELLRDLLLQLFGLASYAIPGALLYLAYRSLRFKEFRWKAYKIAAFSGMLVTLSAIFAFNKYGIEVFVCLSYDVYILNQVGPNHIFKFIAQNTY